MPMHTCRNCDKTTSGAYCSTVCEDIDKHPAPRDDMERFTLKTDTSVELEVPES